MLAMFIIYILEAEDTYLILAFAIPLSGFLIWLLCRPAYLFTWGFGHLVGNSNRLVVNNTAQEPAESATPSGDTFSANSLKSVDE